MDKLLIASEYYLVLASLEETIEDIINNEDENISVDNIKETVLANFYNEVNNSKSEKLITKCGQTLALKIEEYLSKYDNLEVFAGKYDHINFKPPKSVADAAARGLAWRKKNKGKGGLSNQQAKSEGVGSGVQRAVNLKNRNNMSPSTVKRMHAFFSRHSKNKSVPKGVPPYKDKGRVAWELWGGNPGYSWAKKIIRQMNSANKKRK
jgi:hypothetical protein